MRQIRRATAAPVFVSVTEFADPSFLIRYSPETMIGSATEVKVRAHSASLQANEMRPRSARASEQPLHVRVTPDLEERVFSGVKDRRPFFLCGGAIIGPIEFRDLRVRNAF